MAGATGLDDFAFEGYPVSDVKSRYGLKPYRLEEYEEKSFDEVKAMLAKARGYKDRDTIEQHLYYLESFSKKLNMILSSEEREGIMNLEVRQTLSEVRQCCLQLTKKLETVPAY